MASEAEAAEGKGYAYNVLVWDLPAGCTQEEVEKVFSTYGEVVSITMRPPAPDGLLSALVVYDSAQAAADAEELLDLQYSIRRDVERKIRVQWQRPAVKVEAVAPSAAAPPPSAEGGSSEASAPPAGDREPPAWQEGASAGWQDEQEMGLQKFWTENGVMEAHKLWVGSLPPDITMDELKVVFGVYGQVLEVHVLPTLHRKGRSAFVLYSTRDAAEDAIEVLDEIYRIRPNSPWPMQVRRANPPVAPQRSTNWMTPSGGFDGGPTDDWQDNKWDSWWGDDWWGGWDGTPDHRPGRGYEESSWSGAGAKGVGKTFTVERPCPNCSCMVAIPCCEDCHWHHRAPDRRTNHFRDGGKGGPCGSHSGSGGGWSGGGDRWEGGACGSSGGGWASRGEHWEGGACGAAAPEPGPRPARGLADAPGAGAAPGGGSPRKPEKDRRVHVYANLPDDIDEQALSWVFHKYGEVSKVQVMKDEAAPGRAQAFVDFHDPYDAETSVMTLDGKYEIRGGCGPIRLKFGRSAPY